MSGAEMLSIVVPLYKSEDNLPRLFEELTRIAALSPLPTELVFVDDGSPDRSGALVDEWICNLSLPTQLIRLSRNFGAFPAISAGLKYAKGDYFAVIAADLQEPPSIILDFLEQMQNGDVDVVFGVRTKRNDPFPARLYSNLFWTLLPLARQSGDRGAAASMYSVVIARCETRYVP